MDTRIHDGEQVRIVQIIVWYDEMVRYNADHPYESLVGYLGGLHMPIACSPLHQNDLYDEEDVRDWCRRHDVCLGESPEQPHVGDRKKAHAHVIFESKAGRTNSWWCDLLRDFIPEIKKSRWQKVLHPDTAKRYLAHLDSPEKAQYSALDIHSFGGIKMGCLLREEEFVKINSFLYVLNYIDDNRIRYYHNVLRWARDTGDYEIISCVIGRTPAICKYLDSIREAIAAKKKREDAQKANT